ncbi:MULTISPECIES: hypothetical protein [Brachybacterium]|uniref:Uncharacterized protein n=1 Tax=Brachybacterium kimchii TaxID=2942909 RepID=A0ABY4NB93_9MICO|nr:MULTISPECIES: hypothetical protein [Brachybacterium]MCG7309718.1 hypothetical protein [Brachybacterium sp. ACRRE]UQN30565.1 hypothetical protein M4486_04430 [Brachybacterium kimchii]
MMDLLDALPEVPTKVTERNMLDLLHDRYSQTSQGTARRYACAEHVAEHSGWTTADGRYRDPRRADFLAQDCWTYHGLLLHGHEVKVSRSDWLTELRDPTKAEAVKRYCDRWWLVVPDRAIVHDDLPEDWGLMAPGRDGRLRVFRRAPALTPEPIPATFRAALMRAVAKTNHRRGSEDR